MKKVLIFFAIGAVLLVSITTRGQQPTPWLSDAERIRFEKLRESGCEALYNLDNKRAQAEFSEMVRLFPQHPAGQHYLASALFFETLYKSRRLQSSLYSSKSFYSGSEDKVEPNLVKQFRTLTREAQRLAEARLQQYPKDTEALYFLGNVAALKASFEEAVERRHFSALRDGSEAVAKHRRVLELDPNYVDAQVTIGVYDYIIGSLPLPVKLLAGVFGAEGSRKRGLATIEKVAKSGRVARDQAMTLLVILYEREKRYGDAADQAKQLSTKYPRNYLYRIEIADALISQATIASTANHALRDTEGMREALSIYEALLHDKEVAGSIDLIHFKYGEALLKTGQKERAVTEFLAAAKTEGADEGLATMAYLYAAQSLDASNKRSEAVGQYRLVLSRPDVYDAHTQARKGLAQPYKTVTTTESRSQ
jgi:tetratricopeptide (TPR) repeat protein